MTSSPKFLVDVGVGKVVENWLRSIGFDVIANREINPRMTDENILDLAAQNQKIVITMDKDFGELVYHSSKSHKGILLLRTDDATSNEKLRVIKNIIKHFGNKLTNHFCVYRNSRLRLRRIEN